MKLRKTYRLIVVSTIFFLITSSCSVLKKSGASAAKPEKEVLLAESDKDVLFSSGEDHDYSSDRGLSGDFVADTMLSYDTIAFVESVGFEDEYLKFSNKELNNSELAAELVRESPAVHILDSLVNIRFFNDDYFITDRDVLNIYNYDKDYVPVFSDSVYEARIATLNMFTPFELTYNKTVRNFINLYAVNKRDLTARMLGLAEIYFPLFEEVLDEYDMPLELKYLAVVESALIPTAGSRAGAKGLWQFMYRTGKVYDLEVTSMVDDRYDPYKATIAAAQHLSDLYDIYHDWSLALAAYNSGAGNVNKAIRRAGGVRSYWAVWPFLPRETRGYVPAFIAVCYVMNYSAEHNIYPVNPGILYNGIDTVHVHDVLSFDQISEFLNIPYDDVKFLNPAYKQGIIPASSNDAFALRLPREYTGDFIDNEKEIYNYKTKKGIERDALLAQIEKAKQRDVHYVRSGETLGHIARTYHTSVSNIKSWNNLAGSTIYPGQKLVVYASPGSAVASKSNSTATSTSLQRSGEKSFHVVKNGENLGLIAKKYKCTTTDLKNWNNLNNSTIYPNQKLTVFKPESESQASTQVVKTSQGEVKYLYYTVKRGDTLWDIAKQYDGVTVNEIKQLNKLSNSNKIKPGQKLKVAVLS